MPYVGKSLVPVCTAIFLGLGMFTLVVDIFLGN